MTPEIILAPHGAPAADAASCAALHAAAFTGPQPPWSAAAFRAAADDPHTGRVELWAGPSETLVGLALWRRLVEEGEILTVCRAPALAGRGLGGMLMGALIGRARAAGMVELVLEVGETNNAARRLYQEYGFAPFGLRPGYYRSASGAVDNALIMRTTI